MNGTTTYPLFDNAGHLLSRIDGYLVLWDTGAPTSVARHGIDRITIAGQTIALTHPYFGVDVAQIGEAIPAEDEPIAFDVLVGMDVLGAQPVTMDLRAGIITFGASAPAGATVDIPLQSTLGVPLVPIRLDDGVPRVALFDTGACVSYLHSSLWQEGADAVDGWDFFPGYGRFAVRTRPHAVQLGEELLRVNAACLPRVLEQRMLSEHRPMILGSEVLRDYRLYLDMSGPRFALVRT